MRVYMRGRRSWAARVVVRRRPLNTTQQSPIKCCMVSWTTCGHVGRATPWPTKYNNKLCCATTSRKADRILRLLLFFKRLANIFFISPRHSGNEDAIKKRQKKKKETFEIFLVFFCYLMRLELMQSAFLWLLVSLQTLSSSSRISFDTIHMRRYLLPSSESASNMVK